MPGVVLPFNDNVGQTVPPDTPHAVSVSLPTWASNVGYEKGESWVLDKMKCGYPRYDLHEVGSINTDVVANRFFIHPIIDRLSQNLLRLYGRPESEKAMLFPSRCCAKRCVEFMISENPGINAASLKTLNFTSPPAKSTPESRRKVQPKISAVIYPSELWPTAKIFWQHTGEGISSRRADFCQKALDDKLLVLDDAPPSPSRIAKGPRRYQRNLSSDCKIADVHTSGPNGSGDHPSEQDAAEPLQDCALFVEERFGRNLDVEFATQAKLAVKKRIAGSLTTNHDLPESLEEPADTTRERSQDVPGFSTEDVFIFSCGMNAIYTSHRILRLARGEQKSIMYGFPYVDTLKVLEKFGAGAVFYGHSSAEELDDIERRLKAGERFLSLYCEFPGNPLLITPNLKRIRQLADQYDFAVVVDETIGNFLNIHVLPLADIIVSSLTKIFSGDSNVMGGSMILNPSSRYYSQLQEVLKHEYEDNQFEEDSVYLERNSRDFVARIQRVNDNAEAIADLLQAHPQVKQVNYPKCSPTRQYYDACKLPDGGYGGLLSATFHKIEDAEVFYDNLEAHKGPSLGTNFTLASPFVILAHFNELDWAAQYGCEASLIRFSVGLEEREALLAKFERALAAISPLPTNGIHT